MCTDMQEYLFKTNNKMMESYNSTFYANKKLQKLKKKYNRCKMQHQINMQRLESKYLKMIETMTAEHSKDIQQLKEEQEELLAQISSLTQKN